MDPKKATLGASPGPAVRSRCADLCRAKLSGKVITRAEALGARVWTRRTGPKVPLGYGVIGNTTVSGTVILGSSPGIPALKIPRNHAEIRGSTPASPIWNQSRVYEILAWLEQQRCCLESAWPHRIAA